MTRPRPISVLRWLAQVLGLAVLIPWVIRLYGLLPLESWNDDLGVPLLKCGTHCLVLIFTIVRACNEVFGGIFVVVTGLIVAEEMFQGYELLVVYPRVVALLGFLWVAVGLLEWNKRASLPDELTAD